MEKIKMPFMGLREDEVDYLFYLKGKERNRMHWLKDISSGIHIGI